MFAPLLVSLVVGSSLAGPAPSPSARPVKDPPVKVWLSSKGDFLFGQKAKAYVQAAEDGYLIVLHADTRGRVRVLYPLDPSGDQFLRGGKKYEIKGRGGREAFVAADSGRGVVLAAFSKGRFDVEKFTQNGHWDYRSLSQGNVASDAEAALTDLVQQMQPTEHYQYDLATYVVMDPRYAGYGRRGGGWGHGPYGPRIGLTLGYGWPYYGPGYFYDPFYYGPYWRGGVRRWW